MSENTTEATEAPEDAHLAKAPEDAPTSSAVGYAVYDRTLGQFVGSVQHGGKGRQILCCHWPPVG